MKKISKSSELLWVMGVVFVALGVAICNKANLGVSMIAAPAFVVFDAIKCLNPIISVGMVEYIIQGILLIMLCIVIRKFRFRFLLAFAVAVIYGYVLDFFIWLLKDLYLSTVISKYITLIIGDTVTALGVACFFKTYMPLQIYELFVAESAKSFNIGIAKMKASFDISLLVLSVVLAFTLFGDVKSFDWRTITYSSFHSIGLGTLITTAINSPLIALASKVIDSIFEPTPRFEKLKKFISN